MRSAEPVLDSKMALGRAFLLASALACGLSAPGCLAAGDVAAAGEMDAREMVAAGAIPTAGVAAPETSLDELPPEDHLFVFATIADSHIERYGPADYCYLKASHRSTHLLRAHVEDINNHIPPVDFVLHLGDITEAGRVPEFATAAEILAGLECPLYSVLGNHDNFLNDGKQAWKDFAGMDSTSYSFDYMNAHFVVVDCTMDPFVPPYVRCGPRLRQWVKSDLAASYPRPSFVICHYNMWERGWNAKFDTTQSYEEYEGMPALREVLERSGNVVAVMNGHVHASRAELHNGIWYIDVGATLVGWPLIRYFYVCPDRVEARFSYLSDGFERWITDRLCRNCVCCFDPKSVCDFIDGEISDRVFTIDFEIALPGERVTGSGGGTEEEPMIAIRMVSPGSYAVRALQPASLNLSIYDVLGRKISGRTIPANNDEVYVNLPRDFPMIATLPDGVYFLRVSSPTASASTKLVLPHHGRQ